MKLVCLLRDLAWTIGCAVCLGVGWNGHSQSLDDAFGAVPNGPVSTIALQPDGKIVVGGFFTSINGAARSYVARLNANGSLDNSFAPANGPSQYVSRIVVRDSKIYVAAGDGLRRFDMSGALEWVYPIAVPVFDVDSQQRVIFGGQFTRIEEQFHRNIARLNANGALDANFSAAIGCCAGEGVSAVLSQGDTILVGGFFQSVNGSAAAHLARLRSDGLTDGDFVGAADPNVLSLAATPDGKVLRASQQTLARHLGDGSLDPAFATVAAGGSADDRFVAVALQPDGQAIVGGNFTFDGGVTRRYVARVTQSGTVDPSFVLQPNDTVAAIAVQPDGAILLGGNFTMVNGVSRNGLVRISANSPALDISAAVGGKVVLSWSAAIANATLESCALNDTTWSSMTAAPVVMNGRSYVTNSATGVGRLYRLRTQ
jgi:uncharacterized delta-60 repeat protein